MGSDPVKPDRRPETEPSLADLMADPIMALLLQGDGIDAQHVERAVELARQRLVAPSLKDWSAAAH